MLNTHGFCTDLCNVHDNGFDLYHCHVHGHAHVCLYMCMLRPFVPSGQGKRHGLSSYHVTCHRHVYTQKMVQHVVYMFPERWFTEKHVLLCYTCVMF